MDLIKSSDKGLVMSCHALWPKLSKSSLRVNRVVIVVSSMKLYYKFLLDPAVFNLINTDKKFRRGSYLLLMSDSNRHFQDLRSGFYLGVYNQRNRAFAKSTIELYKLSSRTGGSFNSWVPKEGGMYRPGLGGRESCTYPKHQGFMYTFPPPAEYFLVKQGPDPYAITAQRARKQNCSVAMQHSVNASRHDVICQSFSFRHLMNAGSRS